MFIIKDMGRHMSE